MEYYLFRLLDGVAIEEAQAELEKKGLVDSFIIEDDAEGVIFIGGHSRKSIETSKALLVEKKKATVDWNEQWSLFAENFSDGKAHIQLGEKTLLLTPGAGFGDLSHPTTNLMLEMMKTHVKGESVIDIGTGSGILALSALLLGAESAIGIDIDEAALNHAKENARLNDLNASFSKTLPKNLSPKNIVLMNMIFPEQVKFDPKRLNSLAKIWIVSGILESQREKYLGEANRWNWRLHSESKRSEWCGFTFLC